MTPDEMAQLQKDPFWSTWAAYLNHMQPRDGNPMCQTCVSGQTPNDGCEEGRRLYGEYRLARISRGSEAKQ